MSILYMYSTSACESNTVNIFCTFYRADKISFCAWIVTLIFRIIHAKSKGIDKVKLVLLQVTAENYYSVKKRYVDYRRD
jgi:hypothetical protein